MKPAARAHQWTSTEDQMASPNESTSQHATACTAAVPAAAPAAVVIPGYVGAVPPHITSLWLQKRQRHEAAHAIVAHERGGIVRAIVAGGPKLTFGCEIR